ncbi:MAG: hypothetical protein JW847_08680 [Candidatus Omnitrophica bacterium]|nr:hypothetical protein [Candidatus Omnitrophota bacterium]
MVDKQQKLKIALPVLIVIMAFVWGPVIFGSGSKQKAESVGKRVSRGDRPAAPTSGSGSDLMALARSNERKKAKTSFSDWGRNPFSIAESPKASVLEGILWDANNPKAIMNGNILGVGDRVDSGTIIDIQQDSVRIKAGTVEKEYRLGQ